MTDTGFTSALELSDEEFEKMPMSHFAEPETEPDDDVTEDSGDAEDATADPDIMDVDTDDEDTASSDDSDDEDADDTEEEEEEAGQEEEQEEEDIDPDTSDDTAIDYEAEYKRILTPFKANGKQIQVESVDDAIQLMQMGANYHKKMASLKPALKVVKLLEKNDLLDDQKLNLLIDIHNKKPGAITQLIKDSGIDPMNIDVNTDDTYTPDSHVVTDAELDLDTAIDEIKQSPVYNQTLTTVTKEWDETSRSTIAKNPRILVDLNRHMENGIYEAVSSVVERERSLGRLTGVSDLEAYYRVGEQMHKAGAFTDGSKTNPPQSQTKSSATAKKKADNIQRKARKKAAASTKRTSTPSAKTKSGLNPLALSDEEFLAEYDKASYVTI